MYYFAYDKIQLSDKTKKKNSSERNCSGFMEPDFLTD